MSKHSSKLVSTLAPILLALALGACGIDMAPSGPEQRETRSIHLDKAERVRAELKMSAGELNVRGGAAKLLDAGFTYNVAEWKPVIDYKNSGGIGDLTLEQRGSSSIGGSRKNRWDLRFNDGVPIDLRVHFGAGEARLDLGSLSLRSVAVEMGAGSLRVDLRGAPREDYSVRIRGGVGEAVVYLPREVGVAATASGGLGDISVTGLQKKGDRYVNDAYENAKVRIRVDVQGGVGSIKLIGE